MTFVGKCHVASSLTRHQCFANDIFTFESIFPYTHINLIKSKKNLFLRELFKRSKIHEYGLTIALEPFQASQYLMT